MSTNRPLSLAAEAVLTFHESQLKPTNARPLVGVVPELESEIDLSMAYSELMNGGYLEEVGEAAMAFQSRKTGQVEHWSMYRYKPSDVSHQ